MLTYLKLMNIFQIRNLFPKFVNLFKVCGTFLTLWMSFKSMNIFWISWKFSNSLTILESTKFMIFFEFTVFFEVMNFFSVRDYFKYAIFLKFGIFSNPLTFSIHEHFPYGRTFFLILHLFRIHDIFLNSLIFCQISKHLKINE